MWTMAYVIAVAAVFVTCQVCVSALTFQPVNKADFTFDEKVEILRKHNEFRSQAGASNMNQLLWHSDLERIAQAWADNCDFNHNPHRLSIPNFIYEDLGENLYVTNYWYAPVRGMEQWYNEKNNIDSETRRCKKGKDCGHYTQLIWHNAETLGCGVKYCTNMTGTMFVKIGWLVVCNYGPIGNTPNVAVFRRGDACAECPPGRECVSSLCGVPNCGGRTCVNGDFIPDVCMCNCTGTGYEGDMCERGGPGTSGNTGNNNGTSTGTENSGSTLGQTHNIFVAMVVLAIVFGSFYKQ